VFGLQVFDRERIRNGIGVESMSLISDGYEHSHAAFTAATDMNQFAKFQAIAVNYRVTHGFPKCEFNELFFAFNATGLCDRGLISQSTNGEIRSISLRNQVCTSSGAPKRG